MCKINDSETNIQELIQSENNLTKTYASIFIMIYRVFCLPSLFFIYFFRNFKEAEFTKRKTNCKAFDNFKALCSENKSPCKTIYIILYIILA